jgi:hypothetical protein
VNVYYDTQLANVHIGGIVATVQKIEAFKNGPLPSRAKK